MKNFNEWYGPECPPEIATDLEDWCEYQGMKKGWKAALEWAEDLFIKKSAFDVEETINRELREASDEEDTS